MVESFQLQCELSIVKLWCDMMNKEKLDTLVQKYGSFFKNVESIDHLYQKIKEMLKSIDDDMSRQNMFYTLKEMFDSVFPPLIQQNSFSMQDEFFNIIKKEWGIKVFEVVKQLCKKKEPNSDSLKYAYYCKLCGLFYDSNKDYQNFILNMNRPVVNEYHYQIVLNQFSRELAFQKKWDETNEKITELIESEDSVLDSCKNVGNTQSLCNALTNAIVPELMSIDEDKLYEDYDTMNKIANKLNGEDSYISSTAFRIGDKSSDYFSFKSDKVNNLFCKQFIDQFRHNIKMPIDSASELETMRSRKKDSPARIAYRIGMVFVKYNILTYDAGMAQKCNSQPRYGINDELGRPVHITDSMFDFIVRMLIELRVKIKTSMNESWEPNQKRERIQKGKGILRKRKGINIDFEYGDITDNMLEVAKQVLIF